MQRIIAIIGICILIIGSTLTLLNVASQGSISMAGILDRLRQSYPDRSGKELSQALNALPWIMVTIGAIVTAWGVLSYYRSSTTTRKL
jgi:hypothetical protein